MPSAPSAPRRRGLRFHPRAVTLGVLALVAAVLVVSILASAWAVDRAIRPEAALAAPSALTAGPSILAAGPASA